MDKQLPKPIAKQPQQPLSVGTSATSYDVHFSFYAVVFNTPESDEHFGQLFQLVAQQCGSFGSLITGQPPSDYAVKQVSNKVANDASDAVRLKLLPRLQGTSVASGQQVTQMQH